MKPITILISLLLLAGTPLVHAAHDQAKADQPAASAAPAAVWLAKAKADYPLKTCAVSGEDLGSMGEPFDYIHQPADQPARLVQMCCDGCVEKFEKDPAKYLALIDAAAEAGKHSNHSE